MNKWHQRYVFSDPHIQTPIGPCCRIDSGNSGNPKVRSLSRQTTVPLTRSLRSRIGKKNQPTSPLSLLLKGLRVKEGPSRWRAASRKHNEPSAQSDHYFFHTFFIVFESLTFEHRIKHRRPRHSCRRRTEICTTNREPGEPASLGHIMRQTVHEIK